MNKLDFDGFSVKSDIEKADQTWFCEVMPNRKQSRLINRTLDSTFYVSHRNAEFNVWDSLRNLLKVEQPALCIKYLKHHLKYGETVSHRTAWSKVYLLLPGSTLTLSKTGVKVSYEPWIRGANYQEGIINKEPAAALVEALSPTDGPVIVEFSGGTDSTSIAYTVAARSKVLAVTWADPANTNASDIKYATRIAKKLKIEHEIGYINPKNIFSPPPKDYLPDRPSISIFMITQKDRLVRAKALANGCNVLNGHGGDHIFLDPPSPLPLLDLLMSGRLSDAASYYRSLADFYGEGLIAPLRYKKIGQGIGDFKFTLSPGKRLHKLMVQQACYENSIWNNCGLPYKMVHPFTHPAMLSYAMNIDPNDFVGEFQSRLPFRKSMSMHFDTDDFSRVSKGHLTGVFQQAVKLKYKYLAELLSSGIGNKHGLYKPAPMLDLLNSAAVGASNIDPILMNALSMELFFAHWSYLISGSE